MHSSRHLRDPVMDDTAMQMIAIDNAAASAAAKDSAHAANKANCVT